MLNHTRSSENSRSGSIGLDRAANRQPFIPNEPLGTIGGGYHSEFSNPPIRMGDELWFYYGSSQFGKMCTLISAGSACPSSAWTVLHPWRAGVTLEH